MEAVLDKGTTALFAYTDPGAVKAMMWFQSRDLRVPEDIAVVGTGDLRISRGMSPVLTTVRHDFQAMADKALDILFGRIAGNLDNDIRQHEIIDVELVVRESCGSAEASTAA